MKNSVSGSILAVIVFLLIFLLPAILAITLDVNYLFLYIISYFAWVRINKTKHSDEEIEDWIEEYYDSESDDDNRGVHK